jgi:hypothetical protein
MDLFNVPGLNTRQRSRPSKCMTRTMASGSITTPITLPMSAFRATGNEHKWARYAAAGVGGGL